MDEAEKLATFIEALGGNVDPMFAREVLQANGWHVQAALQVAMGDFEGGGGGLGEGGGAAGGGESPAVRAPMRTGYNDCLMAPVDEAALEVERQQQELLRQAELTRRAAEEERIRKAGLERQVDEHRKQAEKEAWERRQKGQEEQKIAAQAAMEAAMLLMGQGPTPAPAPAAPPRPAAAPVPAPQLPAARQAAEAAAATAAALEVSQRTAAIDSLAPALMDLNRRYKDTDPAGLLTCLHTLRKYVDNLDKNSCDEKFQRINCENAAFKTRVGAFEGAVDVLIGCGFKQGEGVLAVEPDFWRTKGMRLQSALNKFDFLIGQLAK